MSKKLTVMLLVLCLAFSLAACSSSGNGGQSSQPQESSSAESSETPQESSEPEEKSSAAEESSESSESSQSSQESSYSFEDMTIEELMELIESDELPFDEWREAVEVCDRKRAETIPEDKLNYYGLTAEEFTALKTSIQEHIDSEWEAEEEYLNYDNGSSNDLWKVCTIIRDDASADFMNDEIIESYIDGASLDYGTSLWKERAIVLAHAVNDWAAQQSVDYDKYVHIWDALSDAFSGLMVADPYYLIPLFDLDNE